MPPPPIHTAVSDDGSQPLCLKLVLQETTSPNVVLVEDHAILAFSAQARFRGGGLEAERRAFYQTLSERDRRRYAAIEARKLGYGGQSYIATILGCEHHTVARGIDELRDQARLEQSRIRQPGGGRKPSLESISDLEATFLQVLADHTAGSRIDETVKRTSLTQREIIT